MQSMAAKLPYLAHADSKAAVQVAIGAAERPTCWMFIKRERLNWLARDCLALQIKYRTIPLLLACRFACGC